MTQISIPEYAQRVGRSRHTVYRWIKANNLPHGVSARNIAGRIVIELQ